MSPAEEAEVLHRTLEDYDWDAGQDLPARMARSSRCSLALALELSYLADGATRLSAVLDGHPLQRPERCLSPLSALYAGIPSGRYSGPGRSYAVPLNRVQWYRYAKAGIPRVFLGELCVRPLGGR